MHKIHLPDWAVARGHNMNNVDAIDPRRTAIVIGMVAGSTQRKVA